MQSITKNSQLIKTFCVSLAIALGSILVYTTTRVAANAETDTREVVEVGKVNHKSTSRASEEFVTNGNLKQDSSEEPCTKPCANLKTEKTTYTRLEPIVVDFSFENIPYAEGYRIAMSPVSRDTNCYNHECFSVGEDGTVTFKPKS
ncbi:MAG: hypothetical protein J7524_04745 [Roseofilum sp. Belize BBD 4]|uniref:hypothetical protein n=1 Tax=Roseofilum sp. Belize BBD 4 TaxID=2821500 RepID=UPI001B200A33|nr:hypothetical protein [Roseofilum sp. Belize BBD 4]MBP0032464.1 hypothetical protein [Roseofilum sp. Belize BBD 4]